MRYPKIIQDLKKRATGYYAERVIGECEYLAHLSRVKKGVYDEIVENGAVFLWESYLSKKGIGKTECEKFEKLMAPAASVAKSYGTKFIAHAHIDMNWMWGYPETVDTTLETFRTILHMMKEYPDLTFGQSQASVYKIVEENEPEMLREIKKQIKRGKWEVTASTWVEGDKNMASGEAMTRHLLYTRAYLKKILGLSDEDFFVDFEPDTFGHSENVPEVLNQAGVKYYYHCRGLDEPYFLYRWMSPSGAEVIAYRDTEWYNMDPDPFCLMWIPEFCETYQMPFALSVFGVGDHGGGPTRRDIERILDMATWPIFPEITFGTYREFYAEAEKVRELLPLKRAESNPRFTGCYTTQSRIKAFNRMGEKRLGEAEAMQAMAMMVEGEPESAALDKEWQKVLFNQFHDILPGSGIVDTREYASGIAQQAIARANSYISQAMRRIAGEIDTSNLPDEYIGPLESRSEGGGVGQFVTGFGHTMVERGRGVNRVMHLFNPSDVMIHRVQNVKIWDWTGDEQWMMVTGPTGDETPVTVVDRGSTFGHTYTEIAFMADVPPFGYSTYSLGEREVVMKPFLTEAPKNIKREQVDFDYKICLENDLLRAEFRTTDFALISLLDKKTGAEQLSGPARLRVILEDNKGMEAWRVGKYAEIRDLHHVRLVSGDLQNPVQQNFKFTALLGERSKVTVKVTLGKDDCALNYKLNLDWLEASDGQFISQLNFVAPIKETAKAYWYAIPFGMVKRDVVDIDLPALNFVAAEGDCRPFLYSERKYGFRGNGEELALTLLRSGGNPDRFPELGDHELEFKLGITEEGDAQSLAKLREQIDRSPIYLSGTVHQGSLPLCGSLLSDLAEKKESYVVSALKPMENGEGFLLRLYDVAGGGKAELCFAMDVKEAWLCDLHEKPVEKAIVSGKTVIVPVEKGRVVSLIVKI
ncbi:MAG: alpha-mannosidase [Clostridia bacterium]|nr:alpha-mannosidase [Clostridia bacterium]MBQ4624040.1 alpha-mannosidase [Clostridia bacterium]